MKDRNGKEIIKGDYVGFWEWDYWRQKNDLVAGKVTGIGSENVEVELPDGRRMYKRADLVEVDNENLAEEFGK